MKEGLILETVTILEVNSKEVFLSEYFGEFEIGQFVILPKSLEILNEIYQLLENYLIKPFEFKEVILPKIAPIKTFETAGILGKWDNYLQSVKPFSKTNGIKEEFLLDPLQCTTFYQYFKDKEIEETIKWFDKSGPTFRNEDLDKLETGIKQREFHRIEFIYLGRKEIIIELRENCLEILKRLFDKLGLKYRIVVGSGCYQLSNSELEELDNVIGIKDLEVYLPHKKRWIEVVGASVLGSSMTKKFNINQGKLWSGCCGIGLDRLLLLLVSYYEEETLEILKNARKNSL